MTPKEFKTIWLATFPETMPLQHLFKYAYPERWFRIHSLPGAKRYADMEEEWGILLERQNTLITDLLGKDTKVFLVSGFYDDKREPIDHPIEAEPLLSEHSFEVFDEIDLHELVPDHYDEGQVYLPAFAEVEWTFVALDKLLRHIADDEVRAFFVSFDKRLLVAPYDGGVDVIVADSATRDMYREKYSEWLSTREDGM